MNEMDLIIFNISRGFLNFDSHLPETCPWFAKTIVYLFKIS
jgi:hypothetical protein